MNGYGGASTLRQSAKVPLLALVVGVSMGLIALSPLLTTALLAVFFIVLCLWLVGDERLFLVTVFLLPFFHLFQWNHALYGLSFSLIEGLIGTLFLIFFLKSWVHGSLPWPRTGGYGWLVFLFLMVNTCALYNARDVDLTRALIYYIRYLEWFALFFLTVAYVRRPEQVKRVFALLLIGALFEVVLGLAQHFTSSYIFLPQWLHRPSIGFRVGGMRIIGTFVNPITYGEYLVIMLGITGGLILYCRTLKAMSLYGLLMLGIVVCIWQTGSRGPLVSSLGVLGLLFLLAKGRRRYLLLAFLILLGLFGTFYQQIIESLYTLFFQISPGNITHRIRVWKAALEMIRDYPLSGVGLMAFPHYLEVYDYEAYSLLPVVENMWLQRAVDSGLPGASLFLGFFLLFYRGSLSLLKRLKPEHALTPLIVATLAGVSGPLLTGMTESMMDACTNSLLWVLFGLGVRMRGFLQRPWVEENEPEEPLEGI